MTTSHVDDRHSTDRVVSDCLACHAACIAMIAEGRANASGSLAKRLLACAIITRSCADVVLLGTDDAVALCHATIGSCESTAAACLALGNALPLQECAHVCRRCATACRDAVAARTGLSG